MRQKRRSETWQYIFIFKRDKYLHVVRQRSRTAISRGRFAPDGLLPIVYIQRSKDMGGLMAVVWNAALLDM
jgi:hypothetical protein